jgi:hypothetical protein
MARDVFGFRVGEQQRYADPVRIRRLLLEQTAGRMWAIVQEVNRTNQLIDYSQERVNRLLADLRDNPPTDVEKTFDRNNLSTTPFDQLPRAVQLESFTGQQAVNAQKLASYEGVMADAALYAFELPPFVPATGEGTTDGEALSVLRDYLGYAEGKGWRLGN